jgi:cytidylate kinase
MKKDELFKYQQKKIKEHPTHYANKYGINHNDLTHKELMENIYRYEMKHIEKLITKGADSQTKEIGYFIQS